MNGWPTWAKLVAGLGFPIIVAIYLLIQVAPALDRVAVIHERQAEAFAEHLDQAKTETALLRAICRNTAKTELQAQFCDYGLIR